MNHILRGKKITMKINSIMEPNYEKLIQEIDEKISTIQSFLDQLLEYDYHLQNGQKELIMVIGEMTITLNNIKKQRMIYENNLTRKED